MKQFKPYPEYKDSGVKWLGDVPRHWEVCRIKNHIKEADKRSKNGEEILLSMTRNKGIIRYSERTDKPPSAKSLIGYKICQSNQIAMNRMQAWSGMFYVANETGIISPDYAIFDVKNKNNVHFLCYLFRNPLMIEQFFIESKGIGSGFNRLYTEKLGSIYVCLPNHLEQNKIVNFINFKTAQIAKFIKSKKRMIELLKEQKQAIINDAVTGKIDVMTGKPYPKYKDSGVKWLGQVPEGWEVKRLKNIALVKPSGVDKKSFDNELPVLLCNYVDVYKNNKINSSINFMKATATKEEIKNYSLLIGDIVITKDSETWKDIAVPAIVTENIKVVCAYHLAIIRIISNKMISPFLFYALYSDSVAIHFRISANGVTRFGLSQGAIKSAIIPIPSIDEQSRIVKYIEMSTTSINNTIERIEREISLMQEFRSRLISDVVTGKIDVRGIEVPEVSEEPSAVDDLNTLDSDESSENEVLDEKVDD